MPKETMKAFLSSNIPFPDRKSILADALFLCAYFLIVLFIFQPFGTFEYAHPHKMLQLSGYCLLILFGYPLIKKGVLLFSKNNPVYSMRQEFTNAFIVFASLTILGFFYHALIIKNHVDLMHLPVFMVYSFGICILPFAGLLYQKWLKVHTNTGLPENHTNNTKLEIKGINLYETFYFNPSDILYLKSNGNYVLIYFQKDGEVKHEIIRNTLSQVSGQLVANDFTNIHRSFLVNAKKFDKVIREDGKHLLIAQKFDIRLPVSRDKLTLIEKKLKDHY